MRLRSRAARVALLVSSVLLLGACGNPSAGLGAGSSPAPVSASPSNGCSPSPALATPTPPRASPSTAAGQLPPVRQIRIASSQQHLWAYQGSVLIVSTDVTTGMPALPTPTGHFHILAKYSPYRFVSPFPRGSPYYFDPLWADDAMLFAPGGYFIHDAWWQLNFGPGGNLKSGSHGCVNVPTAAMPALYNWARDGDDVIVTK